MFSAVNDAQMMVVNALLEKPLLLHKKTANFVCAKLTVF